MQGQSVNIHLLEAPNWHIPELFAQLFSQ